MKLFKKQKGFTLIELLVVIGILAILLAITLIAINPARQFSQANDTKRTSDVNTILNAVNQYMSDNKGKLPGTINDEDTTCVEGAACELTNDADKVAAGTGLDICELIVSDYLAALPVDPILKEPAVTLAKCGDAYATGYTIYKSTTNKRITVAAPRAEMPGVVISVTR